MSSPASTNVNAKTLDLKRLYLPIERDLLETTELLKRKLSHDIPLFNEYLEYSFRLGGKRLRPALVLLCGKAWGKITTQHYLCGAALEMIHTGSLVHDDILDGAYFRRQLQTFNAKWDSKRAVLVGDLLITRALSLICECNDLLVFEKTAKFCTSTVEGELMQVESVGNFELTFEQYRQIVGGKTASLLEASTFLGGYLAGASDRALELFAQFGQTLGVAFQIVDDTLDLVGEEETLGKTLGSDLVNQKETLPLILYFQRAPKAEADAFKAQLQQGVPFDARAQIAKRLQDQGVIDATYEVAQQQVQKARDILLQLKEIGAEMALSLDLQAFESLEALAEFVVKRQK
ncbi:MAG: polyprenyl synthetase family protein [Planctomycetia bacterium]|nr:polyprenyl synthetase family protein [Planctomycetia bacterium]